MRPYIFDQSNDGQAAFDPKAIAAAASPPQKPAGIVIAKCIGRGTPHAVLRPPEGYNAERNLAEHGEDIWWIRRMDEDDNSEDRWCGYLSRTGSKTPEWERSEGLKNALKSNLFADLAKQTPDEWKYDPETGLSRIAKKEGGE